MLGFLGAVFTFNSFQIDSFVWSKIWVQFNFFLYKCSVLLRSFIEAHAFILWIPDTAVKDELTPEAWVYFWPHCPVPVS